VIEVVATAAPGIDDIVVLGKIKQLEQTRSYDLILVDGPAAGHAITFLMAPANLLKLVRGGPIRSQAAEVAELLADPARSQVILVTLPETTPVNEAIETAHALQDDGGLRLGPVVVNAYDAGDDLQVALAPAGRRCAQPPSSAMRDASSIDARQSAHRHLADPAGSTPAVGFIVLDKASVAELAAARGAVMTELESMMSSADVVCAAVGWRRQDHDAAALGLQAARDGRRCVVVTIDPAKRLADALGVPEG